VNIEPRGRADRCLHLHIIAQAIARAVLTTAKRANDVPTNAAPAGDRGARLKRTTELLAALVESDMRARFGRGPWRLIKWLLDPFALVGVYLLLVSFVLDRPGDAVALSLACAVVPFQLVMMSCLNALDSLRQRRSIVANMSFPRTLIPASAGLTATIAFAASLFLLALTMAVYGVAPTAAALWLPVVIAVNVALAVAFAYPAALLALWVPDLRTFVSSFIRTLFFLAPGLIALEDIEGTTQDLVKLNPLTGLFEAYRDALLYGHAPAAWELLVPLATATLLAAVFVPIYHSEQQHLAKVLE
jgi:ABC-type polysaccharide/polyol phosphate export permease